MDANTDIVIQGEHAAGFLIFLVSFTGFVGNSVVALFTRKLSSMTNAFGRLVANQAMGELIQSTMFAFYISPMMIFDLHSWNAYSRHAGFLGLIAYDICIWSHLFVSLNRMCAICLPTSYDKIFSPRTVSILIVLVWMIPITCNVILYKFLYSFDCWAFVYTQNEVCDFISWNLNFHKDISFVISIAAVDLITIIMVKMSSKTFRHSDVENKRRRKMEVNFLKQVVLQGIIFACELCSYFILAWKMKSKWHTFLMSTIAWISVHTFDGIIILLFNSEFRKLLCGVIRKEQKGSAIHTAYRSSRSVDSTTESKNLPPLRLGQLPSR